MTDIFLLVKLIIFAYTFDGFLKPFIYRTSIKPSGNYNSYHVLPESTPSILSIFLVFS